MAKLHELLAVEGPLKTQADKTRTELANTFEKKRHLFAEKTVTFIPNEEGKEQVREEQLDLQSTVRDELKWINGIWSKALDAAFDIAEANTAARADIALENGKVLLAGVPVTALLELEKRAEEIRVLCAAIPTLDPAKGFKPDPERGTNVFRARDHDGVRTRKELQPLVLYHATEKHPAQVKEMSVDVLTGVVRTQEWSGLITPAEKSEILKRAEELARAIKSARSRANGIEVQPSKKVGSTLLSFVFDGAVGQVAEKK